jgi:hypothetical protein
MMKFKNNCSKCGKEFEEKELEISHDFPKYLGGKDNDGRHFLCNKCHKDYEWKVFQACAGYLKRISPNHKEELKKIIIKIKRGFFNDSAIKES